MFPDRYGPRFHINPRIPKKIIEDFIEDDPTHQKVKTLMSVQDRFLLYYVARKMLPKRKITFVDIGTWCGGSAIIISKALMREGIEYRGITVDPRPKESFTRWIYDKFLKDNNVEFIHRYSHVAVEEGLIPEELDFVFVDGQHGYKGIKNDIEHYHSLVRLEGIILVHDAVSRHTLTQRQLDYTFMGMYVGGYQAGEEILKGLGWEPLKIPLLSDKTSKPPGYSHLPDINTLLAGWRK